LALVITPMPSSASLRTGSAAPRAPPPSHSSGRFAARSSRASASSERLSSAGSAGGSGSSSSNAGMSIGAACTSIGISMLTGPAGGVSANAIASRNVPSSVSADHTRNARLETARSIVSWSFASWM